MAKRELGIGLSGEWGWLTPLQKKQALRFEGIIYTPPKPLPQLTDPPIWSTKKPPPPPPTTGVKKAEPPKEVDGFGLPIPIDRGWLDRDKPWVFENFPRRIESGWFAGIERDREPSDFLDPLNEAFMGDGVVPLDEKRRMHSGGEMLMFRTGLGLGREPVTTIWVRADQGRKWRLESGPPERERGLEGSEILLYRTGILGGRSGVERLWTRRNWEHLWQKER